MIGYGGDDPVLDALHAWRARADEDLAILRYMLKHSGSGWRAQPPALSRPESLALGVELGTGRRDRKLWATVQHDVGTSVLEELKAVTGHFVRRSRKAPPLALIGPARGLIEVFQRYLCGPLVSPDGLSAAGEAAILVGRLAQYLDSWGESHAALSWAVSLAQEARDKTLMAHALGVMSGLNSGIPRGGHSGDPVKAIALLDAAITMSTSASAAMRAWLHARRAEEHAAAGHALPARRDLDVAEQYLVSIRRPDEAFFSHLSEPWLAAYRGNCERLLNEPTVAVSWLEQALSKTPEGQLGTQSGVLADLGAALVQRGDADHSAAILSQALDLAVRSGIKIAVERIRGVRRHDLARCADNPLVKELDERLLEAAK